MKPTNEGYIIWDENEENSQDFLKRLRLLNEKEIAKIKEVLLWN